MPRLRAAWLAAAAYSGMFGFGVVMALLGAILPLYVNRPPFDLSKAGDLFFWMNAAMLVTTLVLGPLLDRYGIRPVMILAPLAVAAAIGAIAFVQRASGLTAAVTLLGAGGGALNQATNTLIADLHENPRQKNAALNVLGVFFGFGALFVPFAMGSLLSTLGVRNILLSAAGIILIPTLLSAWLRFPPPRQAGAAGARSTLTFLRRPLVLAFAFLLFFESGNEFTLGGYLSSYLTRELGASLSVASYALAGYWGAIMLARVALGRLLLKARGEVLIRISALGVAACLILLSLIHSPRLAVLLAFLLGSSIAAIFPTVLGLAGTYYAGHAGTVFGLLIGTALTGGMLMPWLAGRIAAAHNIRLVWWIPAGGAVAIFVLELVTEHFAKRTKT